MRLGDTALMGGVIHDGLVNKFGSPEASGAALTIALDVVQAWALVLTLGFTIILLFFLAFCVCSRKEDSYGDYDDYEGIRTVRMSTHSVDVENGMLTDQTSQASSRCTMKRELPAIPNSGTEGGKHDASQQQQSGHQQSGSSGGPCRPVGGVQVLPSTAAPLTAKSSLSRAAHSPQPSDVAPSSSSTISSELATRQTSHSSFGSGPSKEHQYAHLKPTKEHPYAKVGGEPETDTDNYDEPRVVTAESRLQSEKLQKSHYESVLENSISSTAIGESAALYPPSLNSTSAQQQATRSPSIEIQASSAIAGHTPANEELPYMTPKLTQAGASSTTATTTSVPQPARSPVMSGLSQLGEGFAAAPAPAEQPSPNSQQDPQPLQQGGQQQQHFSGDSQDSRGYTSISVREPLSALRAAQPTALPPHMQQEGYYMTVSDDSADETYACIYERNTGSTTTTTTSAPQQTYAQIQPSTTSATASSPPPPSSPGARASPSPLPDPTNDDPPAPPSVDSLKHVLHSRQASSGSTSGVVSSPSCEKRGGSIGGGASRGSPLPPLPQGDTQHYYEATPPPPPSATSPPHSGGGSPHKSPVMPLPQSPPMVMGEKPSPRALEEMYAKVMKKRGSTGSGGHSRGNSCDAAEAMRQSTDMDSPPGHRITKSMHGAPSTNWNIVGVAGGPTASSAATSGNAGDPGYETVQNYPQYETVKNSRGDSEPGYETVTENKSRLGGEECSEPGYETVKGGSRVSEPGYESVSDRQDSEPGYESVSHAEPGYEQVQSGRPLSECDSNYEQLKFTQQPDPGYESVKSGYESETNYERMSDYETKVGSSPMYAEINKPAKQQPVYASVMKKSPDAKPLVDLEPEIPPPSQPEEESRSDAEEDEGSDERSGGMNGGAETDDEGLDDVPNKRKYKRSIEEEAALLVSNVEETAINRLSKIEKSTNGAGGSAQEPTVVAMITKEDYYMSPPQEDLLTGAVSATSDGSDTSSDAVFSRKVQYEQPNTLPGLVNVAQNGATDAVTASAIGNEEEVVQNGYTPEGDGSTLLKKDSGSVETENGTKDTNKASIEVQNGSTHSSVDNSSCGREDISPEDEVCMPPHEGGMYDSTSSDKQQQSSAVPEEPPVVVSSLLVDSNGEDAPTTPTVLSIPVPQSFFPPAHDDNRGDEDAPVPPPLSPPHACLIDTEDELPEQDQQALPPPPPILPEPLIPLDVASAMSDNISEVPPPPDLLNDAPECDLPPPLPLSDFPPPADDPIVPPPPLQCDDDADEDDDDAPELPPPVVQEDEDSDITVTVNPMAEIDELASRVAKACREDLSPTSPTGGASMSEQQRGDV